MNLNNKYQREVRNNAALPLRRAYTAFLVGWITKK